jgi:hypothetical protein
MFLAFQFYYRQPNKLLIFVILTSRYECTYQNPPGGNIPPSSFAGPSRPTSLVGLAFAVHGFFDRARASQLRSYWYHFNHDILLPQKYRNDVAWWKDCGLLPTLFPSTSEDPDQSPAPNAR